MTGPGAPKPRFVSVGTKLALITSCVLILMSTVLFFELSARERTKLIVAKEGAASMLTQLLVTELRAAVDFGDAADIEAQLDHLHTNPDIVAAAVWTNGATRPTAQWMSSGAPKNLNPDPAAPDGATTSADWLVATRTIENREGVAVARLTVTFSLRPENEAIVANRRTLFVTSAGLGLVTALLLALLARRYLVGPLRRLSDAATALARGDDSSRVVKVTSNDEIGDLTRAFNVMGAAVVAREQELKGEMDLAQRIQTAILPRSLAIPGLDVAAAMLPATEVGGDYYDVLPQPGGAWIGIGDVAGHGLDAGLIMLMMQSIVAGLVTRAPAASPAEVLCVLNEVLFDNVRNRLQRDDHATLTLLRYEQSGRILFAGAHEEIVVYRAETGRCESISTPGTWVAARRDIRRGTVESVLQLEKGDVMLLYTDGVTELRNDAGEPFGIERLSSLLEALHGEPTARIKSELLAALSAWSAHPDDDVTLLIARYTG